MRDDVACVAIFHGCIVAPRPPHPNRWKCTQTAPVAPHTIGEHLKARRLALHRFQSDVAKELGADEVSLQNWERGIYKPVPRFYPAIIRFLGYIPFGHGGTPSGMMRWLRCCAGWTQQQLATAARCNDVTVWRWETGRAFDVRLWQKGFVRLIQRLESLGLVEFVKHEVETLKESVTTAIPLYYETE